MRLKSNDIELIRKINTAMVMNELRVSDEFLSRPIVAERLDLSKVTISNIFKDLNNAGYTTEAGVGVPDSRGGRKPLLVTLDRNKKRLLAARLEHEGLEVLLSDITGREIKRIRSELQTTALIPLLGAIVREILKSTNTSQESVIGLVGTMASQHLQYYLQGGRYCLAAQLREALGMPIKLASLSQARAFGECWFQYDQEQPDFYYLNLSQDFEGLVIKQHLIDDRPFELGKCWLSMTPDEAPHRAALTINEALSGSQLLKKVAKKHKGNLDCSSLLRLANDGDEFTLNLLREYGYNLGGAISLVADITGLSHFVIGGSFSCLWKHLSPHLRRSLKCHTPETIRDNINIRLVHARLSNGLMGALALALDQWVYHTELIYGLPTSFSGSNENAYDFEFPGRG